VKKAAIKAAMNAEQYPSLILLGKKTFEELSRQEDARKAVTATIGNIIIEMMHINLNVLRETRAAVANNESREDCSAQQQSANEISRIH
jgi:hypothetical protein